MPNVDFSVEQRKVLDVLKAQVEFVRSGIHTPEFRQSLVIQGKAGSGKSTLIQAIKSFLHHELGPQSYTVIAPTGAAASNIKASTIHSALKINIDNDLLPLTVQQLQTLQENFQHCRFLIVDEMSLIGCTLLAKIDSRCRKAKGCADLPFGGMFLFLFGDFKQLPPVRDRPFYGSGFNTTYASHGQALFKEISASVILPTSHRQAADQQVFRNLLDRLANGETSVED